MPSLVRSALVLTAISALLPFAQGQAPATSPAGSSASVRAGGEDFNFPAPANDLAEAGPDYRVVLEPLAPVNNRLLAAYISPNDLHTLQETHNLPSLHHYALVEIPRRAEFADVEPQIFKQISDAMDKQLAGDMSGSLKDQQDEVNRRLKALGSSNSVTLEQPLALGTLFSKPNECAFGLIMPVTTQKGTERMAAAITVLRVRNRVIFTYLYSDYKDESTIADMKAADERWADAILKANQ